MLPTACQPFLLGGLAITSKSNPAYRISLQINCPPSVGGGSIFSGSDNGPPEPFLTLKISCHLLTSRPTMELSFKHKHRNNSTQRGCALYKIGRLCCQMLLKHYLQPSKRLWDGWYYFIEKTSQLRCEVVTSPVTCPVGARVGPAAPKRTTSQGRPPRADGKARHTASPQEASLPAAPSPYCQPHSPGSAWALRTSCPDSVRPWVSDSLGPVPALPAEHSCRINPQAHFCGF